MTTYASRIDSPIGPLTALVDDGGALVRLLFAGDAAAPGVVWDDARCAAVRAQLDAYFRGELRAFDVNVAPRGTEFQRRVWDELRRIPYGETISYRALAERIGRPAAVRAVGRANATNPIPILVPCHRVIGADGSLTGYAGGMDAKRTLLELEAGRAPRAAA
jgi:methylated-DNA-[protein]-cysteine S-methyltransferase